MICYGMVGEGHMSGTADSAAEGRLLRRSECSHGGVAYAACEGNVRTSAQRYYKYFACDVNQHHMLDINVSFSLSCICNVWISFVSGISCIPRCSPSASWRYLHVYFYFLAHG